MSGTVRANGAALRQRLLDLGITDRRLVSTTGLGPATLRTLKSRGEMAASVTVGTLRRVLDETGLTAAALLDPPPETSDDEAVDDPALLAQLLVHDP